MTYIFGKSSRAKLDTCHSDLVSVAELALSQSPVDITIVHGWRGEDVQNALYESGASQKRYPFSMHNRTDADGMPESRAVDFAPWIEGRIPWKDTHAFAIIAGVFLAAGSQLGVKLRWGGDFDMDGLTTDQTLLDYGHIELGDQNG